MFKLLTNSITIAGLGLGSFCPSDLENKYNINLVVLTPQISPTLDLDPWESYRNKKNQEISDMILEKEIKECLD